MNASKFLDKSVWLADVFCEDDEALIHVVLLLAVQKRHFRNLTCTRSPLSRKKMQNKQLFRLVIDVEQNFFQPIHKFESCKLFFCNRIKRSARN